MRTVARDELRALWEAGSAAKEVRLYPGGKADWWEAGLPLVGTREGENR